MVDPLCCLHSKLCPGRLCSSEARQYNLPRLPSQRNAEESTNGQRESSMSDEQQKRRAKWRTDHLSGIDGCADLQQFLHQVWMIRHRSIGQDTPLHDITEKRKLKMIIIIIIIIKMWKDEKESSEITAPTFGWTEVSRFTSAWQSRNTSMASKLPLEAAAWTAVIPSCPETIRTKVE